jgi:[ribosomal protein S5]-alanine N-acetyltransferase
VAVVLERLRPDHAPRLLAFERENRAYFAASIPDRGDAYFAEFAERHESLLAEQDTGVCHFHVVVVSGEILGRVNLINVLDGSADLGFRVAAKAAGQGLATTAVRELITLATTTYGLHTLAAAAAISNLASRTVLTRTGFTPTGEEVDLNGKPGLCYALTLARP